MKLFYTTIALFLFAISTILAQHNNVELLSQTRYDVSLSDIWGYESEGKEYALVGLRNAFSIVDITDAENAVEVDRISGPSSTWRDIKTWDHYAYVTNETGGGCLIVDLQFLPDSTVTYSFTGEGGENFSTAHNVYIDELGIMYIIGSNNGVGGCLMYDLNEDPTLPKYAGKYNAAYVHDAYARDNILYTSEGGEQAIVDINDKSNPVILGKTTTYGYTHNCWISDDAQTLFTTDETAGTWIVSWDISDPKDIKELDRWQSSPGQNVIPHNTFVFGNYVITSYYTDGVTITDVSDPSNMVQVGNYDTSPQTGPGFGGCWGVYPYLPSGNIIASDGSEGMFVLKPEYKQAAYLNGTIVDAESGTPVFDATVEINGELSNSDLNGIFKYGTASEETFSIIVSKFGYDTDTLTGVTLVPGETTEVTVELTQQPRIYNVSGNLFDADENNKLSTGTVVFTIGDNKLQYFAEDGEFEIDSIYVGDYTLTVGSWGYLPVEIEISATQNDQKLNFYLNKSIYDDFALDYGWTMENNGNISYGGDWQLVDPIGYNAYGFQFSLEDDIEGDTGNNCYVTGNEEALSAVAGGTSSLYSPLFDMTEMTNPHISFHSYIFNFSYNGLGSDPVEFRLSNGTDEIVVHTDRNGEVDAGQWNFHNYAISKDSIELTENMQFSVHAIAGNQNILESGFDVFQVIDSAALTIATNSIANDDDMGNVLENSMANSFNIAENDMPACDDPQYYLISYNKQLFSNAKIEDGILSFDVPNFSTNGNYKITYGLNCGGSDNRVANVYVTIGETIGINEAVQNHLQLNPNPANDFIFVSGLKEANHQVNYEIYDISGQLINANFLNKSSKINLKHFDAGVYVAKFYTENKILSINKIIVE